MNLIAVDREVAVHTAQFSAVPFGILGEISFVTYETFGMLFPYTSTKSFRNLFFQRDPLKLSITYRTPSLALSFTSQTTHDPWWPRTIWGILRVQWLVQGIINCLCELNLPLLLASISGALSYLENNGQERKAGSKKCFATALVHVQAAMSLPIFAINNYTHVHLSNNAFGCAPGRLNIFTWLCKAGYYGATLHCGVRLFATVSILASAIRTRKRNTSSSTESTIVSTNSPNPNSKLMQPFYYSRYCTVSVLGGDAPPYGRYTRNIQPLSKCFWSLWSLMYFTPMVSTRIGLFAATVSI